MRPIEASIGVEYTLVKYEAGDGGLILNIISYSKCNGHIYSQLIDGKSPSEIMSRNEYARKLEHLFDTFEHIIPRMGYGGTLEKRYRRYFIPESIEFYGDYNKYSIQYLYRHLHICLLGISS